MNAGTVLTSGLLIVIGAIVGIFPTLLNERRKEEHLLKTRWDIPLYEMSKDFAATVRQFVHLARRYERSLDKVEQTRKLDEEHAKLRGLSKQICLLGSRELQRSAWAVEHHAYWVREVGEGREDRRLDYYHGTSAEDRLDQEMKHFYIEVRWQLGVHAAEEVVDADFVKRAPTQNNLSA